MKTESPALRNGRPISPPTTSARFTLTLATRVDREVIPRVRREVYAAELGQHPTNSGGQLRDALDDRNVYLVARCGDEFAGFVSLTPPTAEIYSIDKYFAPTRCRSRWTTGLYEVRLLTVLKPHRGRELAFLLMYAAFRWVECFSCATRWRWDQVSAGMRFASR